MITLKVLMSFTNIAIASLVLLLSTKPKTKSELLGWYSLFSIFLIDTFLIWK